MSKKLQLTLDEFVHHAIIDLYELEDEEEVMTAQICNYTGLLLREVVAAMGSLVNAGLIKVGDDGVVTEAENNGYFPIEDGGLFDD